VTTAIGNRIAIPHARIEGLEQVCFAFGITPDGSDFESIDGKPVNIFPYSVSRKRSDYPGMSSGKTLMICT